MGNVLKKSYPCAVCQNCGKTTDIQLSGDYRNLVSQNKTLKDIVRIRDKSIKKILGEKNGIIQVLHKSMFQLMKIMTKEQRIEAKNISQSIREYIKGAEKKW